GIENLKKLIDHMLETAPLPVDYGQPRLWIDRVFTVKGSGTVVTGTLLGGSIEIDDELEVVPSGELVRVRGMQLHNRQISKAPIGGRVALNIAGMYTDLHRGDALVAPEQIQPSSRLNVVLRNVSELGRPIPQLSEMKIYIGTAERIARIKLLDRTELGAGEEALAQIEIDRPCAAKWQDRFVI